LKKMKTAGRKEKIVIMTGSPLDQSMVSRDIPHIYFQLRKPFKMSEFLQVVSAALKAKKKGERKTKINETGKKDSKCYIN